MRVILEKVGCVDEYYNRRIRLWEGTRLGIEKEREWPALSVQWSELVLQAGKP